MSRTSTKSAYVVLPPLGVQRMLARDGSAYREPEGRDTRDETIGDLIADLRRERLGTDVPALVSTDTRISRFEDERT